MSGTKKDLQCYIYTRVSTQIQVDGYSLDAQRERLLREAERWGMAVAAEFSDVGPPGSRPQFAEMMNRIQDGNPEAWPMSWCSSCPVSGATRRTY